MDPAPPPPLATALGARLLGQAVWRDGVRRVAVIGASKNAGKTTALLALLAASSAEGLAVGVVSVGLDGEARDAWLDVPKPQVRLEKDHWLVTALPFAEAAGSALHIVETLPLATALGPTVLARAKSPVAVQLCGIGHRRALVQAIAALQARVPRVIVDGAYHRQAAAHPSVADALVVAVGAVADDDDAVAVDRATATLRALLVRVGAADAGMVAVAGGLTDALVGEGCSGFAVQDSSRILLTGRGWAALDRQRAHVVAQAAVPVAAVVSNPWRPDGHSADAGHFQNLVRAAVGRCGGQRVPVTDLVSGRQLS